MPSTPDQRRLRADAFLDQRLTATIGRVDEAIATAIADEVDDAIESVLGRYLPAPIDSALVCTPMAYWAYDLARGLHWTARRGRSATTTDLVRALAGRVVGDCQTVTIARDVDLAWALGHGRYVEQVFGLGVLQLPSTSLESRHPWFPAAVLGQRIDLVLETMRLTAPGS